MTSRNRCEEIKRYVNSLNSQKGNVFSSLQLIFIDQGDNQAAFTNLNENISFVYITHKPCSLSEARNIGLQYVTGDYICFPDDDCWYDDDTLEQVLLFFDGNPKHDGLVICAKNEENIKINNFPNKERYLTYTDHCGCLSISLFLKYDSLIRFDENIGVGSKYNLSSGEETDYLLTYMECHPHFIIYYKPDIVIRHPLGKYEGFDSEIDKAYRYARGSGYILRKHKYCWLYKTTSLIRPCLGVLKRHIYGKNKLKLSKVYCKGKIEGFFFINNYYHIYGKYPN